MADIDIVSEVTDSSAGESSTDATNSLDELAQVTSEAGDIPNAIETANAKVETAITNLGEALGCQDQITETTIDDASAENPTTGDGKKLKSYWEAFKAKINDMVKSEQSENGESGKDINDSEKTKQSILEKYGPKALAIALIGGLLLLLLNHLADSLSGCYQVFTQASQVTTPTKVNCKQSQCSCDPGGNLNGSQCANPTCNSSAGQSQGVNYYWQKLTDLQALAMLPGIAVGGVEAPAKDLLNSLSKPLMYLAILAAVLIVGYFIYKTLNRQKNSELMPTNELKQNFKFLFI